MQRTLTTTAEEDAAIAWRAAQLGVSEAQIIAKFSSDALRSLVAAFRDDEGSRIYEAFKSATTSERAAVKAALGLDAK